MAVCHRVQNNAPYAPKIKPWHLHGYQRFYRLWDLCNKMSQFGMLKVSKSTKQEFMCVSERVTKVGLGVVATWIASDKKGNLL